MKYKTKNEYVYEEIKKAIATGEFKEGERLVTSDLAKKYEVSAIPIREAINRLSIDGLVEIIPHVGAKVVLYDLVKLDEVQMIRLELECLATRLAAPVISDEVIEKLEQMLAASEKYLAENDSDAYADFNREFHLTICRANPNETLTDYIINIWDKMQHHVRAFHRSGKNDMTSWNEHKVWLEGLKTHDPVIAEKSCRMHIDTVISTGHSF